jgi:hypothetical protein
MTAFPRCLAAATTVVSTPYRVAGVRIVGGLLAPAVYACRAGLQLSQLLDVSAAAGHLQMNASESLLLVFLYVGLNSVRAVAHMCARHRGSLFV